MKTKIKLLLIIFAFQLSECQQPQAVSSPLATLEIPVSTPTEPIATSSATATLPLNNPTSTSILPDLEASLTPYEKNIYLPILLQFERCNLPCWWGIEPGETSWDDAVKVFEYLQVPVNSNWLKEDESFVPFQNQDINFHFALQVDHNDGIVQNIEIISHIYDWGGQPEFQQAWSSYNLGQIFQNYGVPSKILISKPDKLISSFSLWLLYEPQGFTISYYWDFPTESNSDPSNICPRIENGGFNLITVFVQGKNSEIELIDAPSAKTKLASGKWQTPEDLLKVEINEFYSFIIQNSNYCFKVLY